MIELPPPRSRRKRRVRLRRRRRREGTALLLAAGLMAGFLALGLLVFAPARTQPARRPAAGSGPRNPGQVSGRRPARLLQARPEPEPRAARATLAIRRLVPPGLPLYCGGRRGQEVAFSFDDGPGPYTSLALRILRRAGAGATFFVVGRHLAHAGALVRAERALGGLGDHTWTHPYLPRLSTRALDEQLARTQAQAARLSGAPVELFRPPYGAHDPAIDAEARRLGMLEVLWSIDSRDSEGAPWFAIAANVEHAARPGAIVLMHENRGQTIEALKFRILPWFRRHRLVPVSVGQLLSADPPTLAQLRKGERGCFGGGAHSPPGPRFGHSS